MSDTEKVEDTAATHPVEEPEHEGESVPNDEVRQAGKRGG